MDGMDLTCGHFVNPFTDIGFKIIFGQPASKELLITLLNELLSGEHRITNLIFLDKENHSDSMADAGIIYDLYCLTDTLLPYLHGRIYHRGDAEPLSQQLSGQDVVLHVSRHWQAGGELARKKKEGT